MEHTRGTLARTRWMRLVAGVCLLAACASPMAQAKSHRAKKSKVAAGPEFVAREAKPTSNGDLSLTRALDLKIGRIVIDPGHGGWDNGTVGAGGLREKDLVLDISQRLGKILQRRMGADVIYTRDSDVFIPLETRTAIANHENADLFVSIHGNHSDDPQTRGIETYYLSFTAATDALDVAGRENAAAQLSVGRLQDLVKEIAMNEKVGESREFAANVQRSLYGGIGAKQPAIRDRGVKKAPFIVLIGAHMPSILAEVSFLSNATDEANLEKPEYREEIAESLYRGISKYVEGLSGVRPATSVASTAAVGIHLPQLPPPVPVEVSPAPAAATTTASTTASSAARPATVSPIRTSTGTERAKSAAATARTFLAAAGKSTKTFLVAAGRSMLPASPRNWGTVLVGFVGQYRILIVMMLLLGAAWSVAHDYNEPARRFARRHFTATTGHD